MLKRIPHISREFRVMEIISNLLERILKYIILTVMMGGEVIICRRDGWAQDIDIIMVARHNSPFHLPKESVVRCANSSSKYAQFASNDEHSALCYRGLARSL